LEGEGQFERKRKKEEVLIIETYQYEWTLQLLIDPVDTLDSAVSQAIKSCITVQGPRKIAITKRCVFRLMPFWDVI